MSRILIVEDEEHLAEGLRFNLEEEGHSVEVEEKGESALKKLLKEKREYDALVLDVMLPGRDGFEIARRLRRDRIKTPILMLTARDAVPDIISGLDAGADDYLTKPFAFAELLARIRALARRGPADLPTVLTVGDLTLDPSTRQVRRGSREIKLTATEYRLLELLMRHPGRGV